MKKYSPFVFSSILMTTSLLLSSCGQVTIFTPYDSYLKDSDTYQEVSGNNYSKAKEYANITYTDINKEERSQKTFQDVYRYYDDESTVRGLDVMESIGEQKLLVVPISFSDYEFTNYRQTKVNIQNSFFGATSVNLYESVASFYNKSSYGKLKLTGEVTDAFTPSVTYEAIQKSVGSFMVDQIYNEVVAYLEETMDLTSYYPKGNKQLGLPIYMIYSCPNSDDTSSALWAYTRSDHPYFYSWTSIDMLNTDHSNISDSHVLIHEVGHLFGLQDYYPASGTYSPTGKVDMMDYSLGDHTAYSKMLLNWTRPYHVTGSTTISIQPFQTSGDLIVLNDNWNNTAMDEYLVLEYYTPKYLNEFDAKYGNTDGKNNYKLMSQPGIKIYHVDSRLGYYSVRTGIEAYINEEMPSNAVKVGIANSNHKLFRNNPLYQLLQKGGTNTYKDGKLASNADLFYKDDTFGVDTYVDYTFHDGSELGYTIKINEITLEKASITFVKV